MIDNLPEWVTPLQRLVINSRGNLQKNLASHFDSKLNLVVEKHSVEDNSDPNSETKRYSISRLIHVYLGQKKLYTAISITVLMFSVLNFPTKANEISSFLRGNLSIGDMFHEIKNGRATTIDSILLDYFVANPYDPSEHHGKCPFCRMEDSSIHESICALQPLLMSISSLYSCDCSSVTNTKDDSKQLGLYRLYILQSEECDSSRDLNSISIHSSIAELFPLDIFTS